jgi:hypothetical protein
MANNLSDRARSVNKYTHDRAIIPPAHVFITDHETRQSKTNHQQLQHVINRMTGRMGFPDVLRCDRDRLAAQLAQPRASEREVA